MLRLDTLIGTAALAALRGVMTIGAVVAYLQLALVLALGVAAVALVVRVLA